MRKMVPFGRHIKPEVDVQPVMALMRQESAFSQYHSCERKKKFKSQKTAMMELKKIKKTGKLVENAEIYKCQFCDKFHLGHKMRPT